MRSLPLALALLLSTTACFGGGDGGGDTLDIATTPLGGTIAGEPWAFAQGSTNDFLSDEEDFFTSLYMSTYTSCDSFTEPSGEPFMLLDVPTMVGEYNFGLQQNATFVPEPGENLISTSGGIIVDEVTTTTVTARLKTRFDDNNTVEGVFTVDICLDAQP